jgi:nucleoside-diphosphate-sugar epimerase
VKVLVTGANGFVGRAVCEHLRSAGIPSREAVRMALPSNPPEDSASPERVVIGEISGSTDWGAALEGITHIVHLAGWAHALHASPAQIERGCWTVNVDGSTQLVRQAVAAGVRRFVFLSSVKAAAERSGALPLSETIQPVPEDAYGASKLAAEQGIKKLSRGTGMETVVLRPPLVYGPGVRANFLRLLRLVDRGIPVPLGAVRNRRSLVYLGNLVDAIETCIVSPAGAGQTFFVSDGEDVSTPELIRRLASALGRPARLLPVPTSLLKIGASLAGMRPELARLADSLVLDTAKICTVLGWKPPFTLDRGLRETVAWYRAGRRR